jgi:Fe-S-cluster containining protein
MTRTSEIDYENARQELIDLYNKVHADLKKMKLPCREKCNNCCLYAIFTTILEASIIMEQINTMESSRVEELYNNIINWLYSCQSDSILNRALNTSDIAKLQIKLFELKMHCPFLLEGNCGIYEARPLVCRAYFNTCGPTGCTTGIKDPIYINYYDTQIKAEIIDLHARNRMQTDFTLLPVFVMEQINQAHKAPNFKK